MKYLTLRKVMSMEVWAQWKVFWSYHASTLVLVVDTIIGIQRICREIARWVGQSFLSSSSVVFVFFCVFLICHPWLGDHFCVHWLYSLVSCWANIFVCSSSYGNNFCVHWLSNLFVCSKYMKIFTTISAKPWIGGLALLKILWVAILFLLSNTCQTAGGINTGSLIIQLSPRTILIVDQLCP